MLSTKRIVTASACAMALLVPSAGYAKHIGKYLNLGDDVRIAKYKDVEVRAQCVDAGGGNTRLDVYGATSADQAVLNGDDNYAGNGSYLTPATLPADAQIAALTSTVEVYSTGIDDGWVFSLETLVGLSVQVETTMLGVNTELADCVVSANVEKMFKPKKGK
jgi:hypothetical protein